VSVCVRVIVDGYPRVCGRLCWRMCLRARVVRSIGAYARMRVCACEGALASDRESRMIALVCLALILRLWDARCF
jgi:hypothetical protein